jgi:cell division transport system permease protein
VVRVLPDGRLSDRPAELRLLVQALDSGEYVETAVLDLVWLDRLNSIVSFVDRLSYGVGFLLAVGILLILGNTVRLTIENRRDEIIVIKLVGGTDRFVRRPLIYTGFWYGLLGGIAAAILVALVGLLLSFPLQRLLLSYQSSVALPGLGFTLLLKLAIIGAVLGCGGAWISVLQHLRKIEPQ